MSFSLIVLPTSSIVLHHLSVVRDLLAMDENILDSLGARLTLTTHEKQSVMIPEDLWNDSTASYELCLVGRVLSRKAINLEAFEKTLVGVWDLIHGVTIQKLGEERLLFQFAQGAEKDRVYWCGL